MELNDYYNLSECNNRREFLRKLDEFKNDSKIEWNKESDDVIKIEDIELNEFDIEKLLSIFDEYEVLPDMDYEVLPDMDYESNSDDDYYYYDDEESDEY
jgi:hypothetical protein